MRSGISLDALIVLDSISRKTSFAAAAEELHRVPSSVTYAIQKLEDSLGVKLFDRRGHRALLTPAGKALLHEGRHLLIMADGIERNVKRVATGWEAELRIAVGDLMPYDKMLQLCKDFYQIAPETRLQLSTEVLSGAWDALASDRVDFVIGAPGDGPAGGGYSQQALGRVEFVFVVAPDHPLAELPEPLSSNMIRRHRAVAAADTSRGLPPRTVGLLPGQTVLTVPDMVVKRQAHIKGLGVGYMPKHLIIDDIDSGRLIVKATEDNQSSEVTIYYAWRSSHRGNALTWFKQKLCDEIRPFEWFGL
ncbi:MAG: LysR family transcriptional regulator [Gammaproteobacteria bacterium]|nr:LysR family transcriptional regulator [Gammaproteobacteria bacterium]